MDALDERWGLPFSRPMPMPDAWGDGDGERGARGGHRGGGEADEGDAAALRGDADATTARRA